METFLPALTPIALHAEDRLLINLRDQESNEEPREIIASYGELKSQARYIGESVLTLKLSENVSNALAELQCLDKIFERVEPDYLVGSRQASSRILI